MSQTLSPSLARCYGMARVARVWKLSRASVYRSLKETLPNKLAGGASRQGRAITGREVGDRLSDHIVLACCFLLGEGDADAAT
jgi:hypothetical protein